MTGPFSVVPGLISEAEAAPSRDKRKIKKLKKQNRGLRRNVVSLKRQLVFAKQQIPDPVPFIEMVTVGNPGNAPDSTTLGAVAGTFEIGQFEVTNAQYVEFLNAVAEEDPNELYHESMKSNGRGGIVQFRASPNFVYFLKAGRGNKPVNYVNFWDACRFCNWLHNERPSGAQDNSTTEAGAYTLTAMAPVNESVDRNPGAKFFIPTEAEWYKAAYHQPEAEGGDSDNYWLYPTGNNTVPTVGTVDSGDATGEISNDDGNVANYKNGASYDATGGPNPFSNVTAVGSAGAGSASFYGTSDQGGNVFEFNETEPAIGKRGIFGGSYTSPSESHLSSAVVFGGIDPDFVGDSSYGFRVASP